MDTRGSNHEVRISRQFPHQFRIIIQFETADEAAEWAAQMKKHSLGEDAQVVKARTTFEKAPDET